MNYFNPVSVIIDPRALNIYYQFALCKSGAAANIDETTPEVCDSVDVIHQHTCLGNHGNNVDVEDSR